MSSADASASGLPAIAMFVITGLTRRCNNKQGKLGMSEVRLYVGVFSKSFINAPERETTIGTVVTVVASAKSVKRKTLEQPVCRFTLYSGARLLPCKRSAVDRYVPRTTRREHPR